MPTASPIKFSKKYFFPLAPNYGSPTPAFYIQHMNGDILSNITVRGVCTSAVQLPDTVGSLDFWTDSSMTTLLYNTYTQWILPHQQWNPTFVYNPVPGNGVSTTGSIYITTGKFPTYTRGSDGVFRGPIVETIAAGVSVPMRHLGFAGGTYVSFMYQDN